MLCTLTIEIVHDGDDERFTEALNSGLAAMQRECRAVASFARIHSVRRGPARVSRSGLIPWN